MITFIWLVCFGLYIFTSVILGIYIFQNPQYNKFLKSLWNKFLSRIRSPRQRGPKYPIELWVWETSRDDYVCEDCWEKATWPPMDIADWMKEGLPGTPESDSECGDHCRCRLIPYNPQRSSKPYYRYE